MSDTYLQLVSDFMMETGLQGGNTPSAIADATGDARKACYWLRQADVAIQRERIDWLFLWAREDANLKPDSRIVPAPSAAGYLINRPIKGRVAIIDSNGESHKPVFMRWNEFSPAYEFDPEESDDYPSYWTFSPDRSIILSHAIESSGLVCRYEYWRRPQFMNLDGDRSPIPDEYSRLIICRAKLMYAEHEDAPEVEIGAAAEYDIMFNQMEAVETPEAEWQRLENNDELLVVGTR